MTCGEPPVRCCHTQTGSRVDLSAGPACESRPWGPSHRGAQAEPPQPWTWLRSRPRLRGAWAEEAEARGVCGGVAWSWEAPPLDLEGVVLGVPTSESCSAQGPRCGALTVTQRLLLALVLSLSSPINTAVITKYSRYAQRLPPPALAHGGRWEAGEWHNPAPGTQGRGTDAPGERRQIPAQSPGTDPMPPPHSDSLTSFPRPLAGWREAIKSRISRSRTVRRGFGGFSPIP